MKKETHPKYHKESKIICACGHKFEVGSVQLETHVETCSNCHPFYTGKQKLMDTAGRVDRYQRLMEKKKPTTSKKHK